jgi:NADH-quinone oxidoreductase subunit C
MTPQELCDTLKTTFGDSILETKADAAPDPVVKVAAARVKDVALFLRDDERTLFDVLMCLSGMDYTGGKLGVVYHVHSMKWNHKIVIKVEVTADNPHVPSVESVWKTANWHEREAFDVIGVVFDGHPDLRRILLPDDWAGHPLRKDYQVQEFYNGMKVPY